MKAASRQQIRFSGTGTSGTETISSVTVGDTWLIARYEINDDVSHDESMVRFWLSNGTTLNWERGDATDGSQIDVTVTVLEMGTDTTVQNGSTSLTGTTATASISTVDQNDAFIIFSASSDDTTDNNPHMVRVSARFTSNTEITFERNNSTGTVEIRWYVIESTTLTVQSGSISVTSTSGNTDSVSPVVAADTFLVGSFHTNEATYPIDEGAIYCDLQNTTTVRGRLGFAGATNTYHYFLVEDSDQTVQTAGDSVSNATSGTDSISAIVLARSFVLPTVHPAHAVNDSSYQPATYTDSVYFDFWLGTTTTINWERNQAVSDTHIYRQAIELVDPVAWEQEGYRWRNDDGSESAATWKAAQDTDITGLDKETTVRLRVLSDATGDPPTAQATLQVRKVGEPDALWRDVE